MSLAAVTMEVGFEPTVQAQRPWGNYVLSVGTTDVWLQFNEGRLVAFQINALVGLMGMKTWPKEDLCRDPNP